MNGYSITLRGANRLRIHDRSNTLIDSEPELLGRITNLGFKQFLDGWKECLEVLNTPVLSLQTLGIVPLK
jgi:hypothetical protein